MADLIRTPLSGGACIKDKLSPSTGSDDGGEAANELVAIEPNEPVEVDEIDIAVERVPPAPPESEWYHGRLDR